MYLEYYSSEISAIEAKIMANSNPNLKGFGYVILNNWEVTGFCFDEKYTEAYFFRIRTGRRKARWTKVERLGGSMPVLDSLISVVGDSIANRRQYDDCIVDVQKAFYAVFVHEGAKFNYQGIVFDCSITMTDANLRALFISFARIVFEKGLKR